MKQMKKCIASLMTGIMVAGMSVGMMPMTAMAEENTGDFYSKTPMRTEISANCFSNADATGNIIEEAQDTVNGWTFTENDAIKSLGINVTSGNYIETEKDGNLRWLPTIISKGDSILYCIDIEKSAPDTILEYIKEKTNELTDTQKELIASIIKNGYPTKSLSEFGTLYGVDNPTKELAYQVTQAAIYSAIDSDITFINEYQHNSYYGNHGNINNGSTAIPVYYLYDGEEIDAVSAMNALLTTAKADTTDKETIITYSFTDDSYQRVVEYKEINSVSISKQAAGNSAELPGAILTLSGPDGYLVQHTSTTEPWIIYDLPDGEYTLTEELAPTGYELASSITFTVENGKTSSDIVMIDEPSTTPVSTPSSALISKTDATTGAELPGATLIVKDSNGSVIEQWVSTTEPHYIALEPGDYTLTEKYAPSGYKLSSETVAFTVTANSVTKVEMKNEKRESSGITGGSSGSSSSHSVVTEQPTTAPGPVVETTAAPTVTPTTEPADRTVPKTGDNMAIIAAISLIAIMGIGVTFTAKKVLVK